MKTIALNNKTKVLLLGGCAAALAAGGTLAYLTASDSAINEFSITEGLKDNIEVIEPSWDPEDAKDMIPTETVAKDPQLVNDSTVDAYAIMQISVPHKNVITASEDGTLQQAASLDLFTYQSNPAWEELGSGTLSEDGTKMIHTYLYSGILAAGETTESVFDEVSLINVIDGQIDGMDLTIDVDGFAIQAEGFSSAADAWSAYQKQNAQ